MKNRVVILVVSIFAVFISIAGSMFLADEIRWNTPDENYYIADNVTAKHVSEYADGTKFEKPEYELYMVTVEITNNTAGIALVTYPPFSIKDGNGYYAQCSGWDNQGTSNIRGHGAYILPGATLVKDYYFEVKDAIKLKLLYNSSNDNTYNDDKCDVLGVEIER